MPNRLITESSPYLQQHANNPVDWYPFGKEAFEEAKRRNCPILISIGYSACHWCHVMEHESFSNPEIAELMNAKFVCIKVDREERPDVDQIYLNAVQLIHGQGGWPLNCFTLPDGSPFWGGTYFRPEQWTDILEQLSLLFQTNYNDLLEQSQRIRDGIKGINTVSTVIKESNLNLSVINEIYKALAQNFDKEYGGLKGAPKFPMPSVWEFVSLFHHLTKEEQALTQYLTTLKKISMGGIFDQIAGGFARYSTDKEWKVPHFEKMLYDNAQLSLLYADAYKLTTDSEYLNILSKTLRFISAELTSPEGAFYTALDADSEGKEGKFYVWVKDEILTLLPEYGELLSRYWGVEKEGLWEENRNILLRPNDDDTFAKNEHLSSEELRQLVNMASRLMLNYRNLRVHPGLDDKIIVSWNAMMIKAYAHAANGSDNNEWLNAAITAAKFIEKYMISEDGHMKRSWKSGLAKINGFLDDYAFTAEAFIELYQATFDEYWLFKAKKITEVVLEEFTQKDSPMFWYLPEINEETQLSNISRILELSDGVEPSGNSIMAKVLLLLGNYFENEAYITRSAEMCSRVTEYTLNYPSHHAQWATCIALHAHGINLIAITGADAFIYAKYLKTKYNPFIIIASSAEVSKIPALQGKFRENKTLIYNCVNHVCQAPVEHPDELTF